MRCIICGKEKEPSKEHIISESFGNKSLCTYMVCEQCNKTLGQNVDVKLTDMFFNKILRSENGVTGKKGKRPKILPAVATGDDGKKYDLKGDTPKLIPNVVPDTEDPTHIRIEAANVEEAMQVARVYLGKHHFENVEEIITNAEKGEIQYSRPAFKIPITINFNWMSLAVCKIAYEYACEKIGDDYYDDPIAVIIRAELQKALQYKRASEIPEDMGKTITPYVHFSSPEMTAFFHQIIGVDTIASGIFKHMIILMPDAEGKLICLISLLMNDACTYVVMLSENAGKYLSVSESREDFIKDIRSCIGTIVLQSGELFSI